ncbi:MAG: L,D-transpeptidase [Chthoniobacterales bacterium]
MNGNPSRSYLLAMRLVVSLVFVMASSAMSGAPGPLRTSRQCVVVVAEKWSARTGMLGGFERAGPDAPWKMHGKPTPVVLGKKGLAWGVGLLPADRAVRQKREGDNKVPAGVFKLGPAFGYAPADAARWIRLKYSPLTEQTEAIDDPRSQYYNRLVERSQVARVDWHSSEQMRRKDHLYKWGIVVDHNPAAVPGAGSCIFIHIWKDSASPTVGCTAMPETELVNLLKWLDPAAHPVLVQLPRDEYFRLRPTLSAPRFLQ